MTAKYFSQVFWRVWKWNDDTAMLYPWIRCGYVYDKRILVHLVGRYFWNRGQP